MPFSLHICSCEEILFATKLKVLVCVRKVKEVSIFQNEMESVYLRARAFKKEMTFTKDCMWLGYIIFKQRGKSLLIIQTFEIPGHFEVFEKFSSSQFPILLFPPS